MTKSKVAKGIGKQAPAVKTAMEENDLHTMVGGEADAIPPAESGGHSQSAAAHLHGGGEPHTKPAGNLRQGSNPGALREPPMNLQRIGKQHRG